MLLCLPSTTDVNGQESYRIRVKTQIKGYYAVQGHSIVVKVIEVGINSKARVRFPISD